MSLKVAAPIIFSLLFATHGAFACMSEQKMREELAAKIESYLREHEMAQPEEKVEVTIFGPYIDGYATQTSVNGSRFRSTAYRPVLSEDGCHVEKVVRFGLIAH